MKYEFTGRIVAIKPVQTFGSGFQKQEVVIDDEADKYPQQVAFSFHGKKVGYTAQLREGDRVTVEFCINGREWNGRNFVELSALAVHREDASQPELPGVPPAPPQAPAPAIPAPAVEDPGDPTTWHNQTALVEDLPF